MKIIILLFCFLFPLNGQASEVWVTTNEITSQDTLEDLASQSRDRVRDADFIPVLEGFMGHPVLATEYSSLINIETRAQSAALNGSFARALKYYENLWTKLQTLPNVSGIQKISLSTLINIAQLHDILKYQDAEILWRRAHAWMPTASLSPQEFSPSTLQKFKSVTNAKARIKITTDLRAFVFVDGNRIRKTEGGFETSLEMGFHQIAVIAPGTKWFTKNVNISRPESKWRIELVPLVTGTCLEPRIDGASVAEYKLLVSFKNENCERVYHNGEWYSVAGRKMDVVAPVLPKPPTLVKLQASAPETKSWWDKASHSGWFWTGVGAAIVGTVWLIKENQNSGSNTIPTHVER